MSTSFHETLYKGMVCMIVMAILGCGLFENELKARFLYEEIPLDLANQKDKPQEPSREKANQAPNKKPYEKGEENQEISMQPSAKHGTIMEGADSEQGPTPSAQAPASPSTSAKQTTGQLEKINLMSVAEYERLNGVGPVLAKRIYEDRLKNGPFKSLADLNRVKGIGDKKLKKILDSL